MGGHAPFSFRLFAQLIADQRVFAVHQYRLLHLGQLLYAFEELPVVNVAEVIVNPAIAAGRDEAFEPHHAHFIQLVQPVKVIGDQAAKLRGIDGQLAFRGVEFQLNGLSIDGCWQLVQRHFDHRSDAAFCRRAGARFVSFPVGTARLRDVRMRIDHPRRNDQPRGIHDLLRVPQVFTDSGNFAVSNRDIDHPGFVFQNDGAVFND